MMEVVNEYDLSTFEQDELGPLFYKCRECDAHLHEVHTAAGGPGGTHLVTVKCFDCGMVYEVIVGDRFAMIPLHVYPRPDLRNIVWS